MKPRSLSFSLSLSLSLSLPWKNTLDSPPIVADLMLGNVSHFAQLYLKLLANVSQERRQDIFALFF